MVSEPSFRQEVATMAAIAAQISPVILFLFILFVFFFLCLSVDSLCFLLIASVLQMRTTASVGCRSGGNDVANVRFFLFQAMKCVFFNIFSTLFQQVYEHVACLMSSAARSGVRAPSRV